MTIEYLWSLYREQKGRCKLTGVRLTFPKSCAEHYRGKGNASLDRINSKRGYVVGNVQWVIKPANLAKHSLTEKQFVELCRKVVAYHG